MTTATTHTWTFPRVPLALNKLLRAHWRKRGADKGSWETWVYAKCRRGPCPEGRVRLQITVFRHQLQDPDNRVGSAKPVVDALRRAGWMKDDTDEFLDLVVREEIDRKNQRTEVKWEVIDEHRAETAS